MKKSMNLFISCILTAGIITSCNSKEAKTDDVKDEVTNKPSEITFMIPDRGAPSEDLLAEFEKESNVNVEILPTSWDDIRNKISTASVGNTVAADVFEVDRSWVGEFQSADRLLPITLEEGDIKDIPTLSSFTIDDDIYALPYANDFRIAYYNTDMFNKAGIEKAPETWDDVIKDAKELKEKNITQYPVSLPLGADENTTTTFLWLAYTRNGVVFNDDGTLNKESASDALSVIDTLYKDGLINPANRSSDGMYAYRQISNGETSFIVGPSSFVGRVNDPKESEVVDKVLPIKLPGKDAISKSSVAFPEAVGISKNTKHPKEAEEFVKWYTSADTQRKMFDELNTIPTRLSILEELIDNDKIKNSGAMVELAGMVESVFPNGVPKYYSKMSAEIFNVINQMVTDKITLDEARDKIVENVDNVVNDNK